MAITSLFVQRSSQSSDVEVAKLFHARGVATPDRPDKVVTVSTGEVVAAALGLRFSPGGVRVLWVVTNKDLGARIRHTAVTLGLSHTIDYSVVSSCDIAVSIALPLGLHMIMIRLAGRPKIERTARYSVSRSVEHRVPTARKRRVSARAQSDV